MFANRVIGEVSAPSWKKQRRSSKSHSRRTFTRTRKSHSKGW
jgi:hypothetical protein